MTAPQRISTLIPEYPRSVAALLADGLTKQRYSPVVVRNYCAYARDFLAYLAQREIPITTVTPARVEQYLHHATVTFRRRRGRPAGQHWHAIPRSGIHALLRLAQGQWPPEPDVVGPEAMLRHEICLKYETWLRDERGLRDASIVALMAEARHFLAWQLDRGGAASLKKLSVREIDLYMDAGTAAQVAQGLRRAASFAAALHASYRICGKRSRTPRHRAAVVRVRGRALDLGP